MVWIARDHCCQTTGCSPAKGRAAPGSTRVSIPLCGSGAHPAGIGQLSGTAARAFAGGHRRLNPGQAAT